MCTIFQIKLHAEVAGSKWRRVVWSTGITGCKSGCWTCNTSSLWLWSNYFLWWKVLSKHSLLVLSSLKCTLIWPLGGFWLHLLQLYPCAWIIFNFFLCTAGLKLGFHGKIKVLQMHFSLKFALSTLLWALDFCGIDSTSESWAGLNILIARPKYHFGYSLTSRYVLQVRELPFWST